jgi:hypothetical protein
MKRWMPAGLSLLLLCVVWSQARGNAPYHLQISQDRLDREKLRRELIGAHPPEVKLVVLVDEKAKMPRLQVPVNLLRVPTPPVEAPRRGADAGRLSVPTLVAGLALTLAFSSGGLWLARRRWGRPLSLLLVLSLFAAGTAAVWADLGPRPLGPVPNRRPAPPAKVVLPALKLPAGIELPDKIVLETIPTGDHLTLIVPKKMILKKDKIEAPKEKTGN